MFVLHCITIFERCLIVIGGSMGVGVEYNMIVSY